MNRLALLSAAALGLTTASVALAQDDGVLKDAVDGHAESEDTAIWTEITPVILVSWDGDFELLKQSRRLRVWRPSISYRLMVDAEGNATDCELTETFRMRHVSETICDVLIEHHTFEPAMDPDGNPVEGEYTARISYQDVRDRL